MSQAASEAWTKGNRDNQLFSNSSIESTLRSFKSKDTEALKVKYETTLRGADLSRQEVVHSTLNQVMNITYYDLQQFDYVFIDECHTLSSDMSYRSDVITKLLSYLIEFVAKIPEAKTKIVFMTGTPDVEVNVIKELMKDALIEDKFQRLIVDKVYKVSPRVDLVHLNTMEASKRKEAVIQKIEAYVRQGRKVVHVFNHKLMMDDYMRELQTRISNDIKVGFYYSGSTGECTQNILASMFGDFDVVLSTNFFINGLNINRDGLTPEEVSLGKESKQKYAVVIDLGTKITRIPANESIQAINRFRNRRVHGTIFLPPIFKPNKSTHSNRKFDFGSAMRVLSGRNRFVEFKEGEVEEVEIDRRSLAISRRTPSLVTEESVLEYRSEVEQRERVQELMSKYSRIYNDWFLSIQGFYTLLKDAGIKPYIKNAQLNEMKLMDAVHEELENEVTENFLNNDKFLNYLDNHVEYDKRFRLASSGLVKDPEDTSVDNLRMIDKRDDVYILRGDFHESHTRNLNSLISAHLNFSHWYGASEATELFRYLIDPNITMTSGESTHHVTKIMSYLNTCKIASPRKYSNVLDYLKGLDIMSELGLGVIKSKPNPTSISYVIESVEVLDLIQGAWADSLFESTKYKIETAGLKKDQKEYLLKLFEDRDAMKRSDLEELSMSLGSLGLYQPMKINKEGKATRPETLSLTRVLPSSQLKKPHSDFDVESWVKPKTVDKETFDTLVKNHQVSKSDRLVTDIKYLKAISSGAGLSALNRIDKATEKDNFRVTSKKLTDWVSKFGTSMAEKDVLVTMDLIKFLECDSSLLIQIFDRASYTNFIEAGLHHRLPSLDPLFFTSTDFEWKDLEEDTEIKGVDGVIEMKILEWLTNNVKQESNWDSYRGKKWYVAVDEDNIPVAVSRWSQDIGESLILYVESGEGAPFITKDGVPPRNGKGIYNPNSFKRDYLKSGKMMNYKIKTYISSNKS